MAVTTAIAGVAVGGALRQWARTDGHESIQAPAPSDPAPGPELVALVGAFNGTDGLPRDVYAAVLAGLRAQPALVDPIVAAAAGAEDGLAAAARSFIRGVGVGASAYGDQPPRRRPRPRPRRPQRFPASRPRRP